MKILLIFAVLAICGFLAVLGVGGIENELREQAALDAEAEWKHQIILSTYTATSRMYECTSEIYATLHGGGPICKDACRQYADILKEEQAHANWMTGEKLIEQPDPKVCNEETGTR